MRKIFIKELARTDMRLGRNIEHDSMSLQFPFDTTGLEIVSVVHTRHIPILDQGSVGSCTGNAGIGALGTDPFGPNVASPFTLDEAGALKLYGAAQVIDGGQAYPPHDTGSTGLSIAKALKNAGVISGYQHTFTLDDALKAGSLYPFITGITWYDKMFTPDADGRVHPTGNKAGGHEIECNEIDVPNKRIWFCNSWGANWGIQGRFYLTFEDFGALLAQQGDVTVLLPLAVPAPQPLNPVLQVTNPLTRGPAVLLLQQKIGVTADGIFGLQTRKAVIAFQKLHGLAADGVVGPATWQAINMIDIITRVTTANGIEPELGIAVASCESSLNPRNTLYNPPSKSTDRGLFMWNNVYHKEISDTDAFDPEKATQHFCDAIKLGNLQKYWSASEACWSKKLSPGVLAKYHIA